MTAAPKFTPGPWDARGKLAGVHVVGGNPSTLIVAFDHNEAHETNEANARLIAAAPELYEALRHLVQMLEPMENGGLGVPGLATLNYARAALAKVAP